MKRDGTHRTRAKNSKRTELKYQSMVGIQTGTTFPDQALYTLKSHEDCCIFEPVSSLAKFYPKKKYRNDLNYVMIKENYYIIR